MKFLFFQRLVERHTYAWQKALIEKHCDEVQHMYQQMRVWKYNYKNHLQVMKAQEHGKYFSTKSVDRGLGIISIDSIVKKYKGYVNRQQDELIFATEIMLPF